MENKTSTILMNLWKATTLTALTFGVLVSFSASYDSVFYVMSVIIIGLLTGWIAKRNGREDIIWPIIYGITWGIIALFYYAISPKKLNSGLK